MLFYPVERAVLPSIYGNALNCFNKLTLDFGIDFSGSIEYVCEEIVLQLLRPILELLEDAATSLRMSTALRKPFVL